MTAVSDPLFDAAVAFVLRAEGIFSDRSGDPGGPTLYGIARKDHPDIPWPPTKDQAIAIYRAAYWDTHCCGEMPWCWALGVFDGEVNQGSVIRLAQQALGLAEDGAVGPRTLTAMGEASRDAFALFLALRVLSYCRDGGFASFGKGWLKRLFQLAAAAAGTSGASTG